MIMMLGSIGLWNSTRPLRIEYPKAVYHVTARGNAPVFEHDADRASFLDLIEEAIERFDWRCYAY